MLINCILVGAGGFLGSVMRYLAGLIPAFGGRVFPWSTFLVNFLGAVAISAVASLTGRGALSQSASLFLRVGLCGGFTTFSAFSLEAFSLFDEGRAALGALYMAASVVCCLAGIVLGRLLVRLAANS